MSDRGRDINMDQLVDPLAHPTAATGAPGTTGAFRTSDPLGAPGTTGADITTPDQTALPGGTAAGLYDRTAIPGVTAGSFYDEPNQVVGSGGYQQQLLRPTEGTGGGGGGAVYDHEVGTDDLMSSTTTGGGGQKRAGGGADFYDPDLISLGSDLGGSRQQQDLHPTEGRFDSTAAEPVVYEPLTDAGARVGTEKKDHTSAGGGYRIDQEEINIEENKDKEKKTDKRTDDDHEKNVGQGTTTKVPLVHSSPGGRAGAGEVVYGRETVTTTTAAAFPGDLGGGAGLQQEQQWGQTEKKGMTDRVKELKDRLPTGGGGYRST